jgi:hypothetical protein
MLAEPGHSTSNPVTRVSHRKSRLSVAFWIAAACLVPIAIEAQIDVLTNRYDRQLSGANLRETHLTAQNVNVNQLGKLYAYPVDGAVYGQPLYVSGLTIQGVVRNVLYVATMNDKVYAFDADSSSPSPLWRRDFTSPPSIVPVPITDIASGGNIIGNVGIQSTPVINRAAGTLYVVARTKDNGAYVQRLHALDVVTGQERTGSPVKIRGSVPGNALDSTVGATGRVITFDPKVQLQRAGLALTNGVLLVSWAAHEDITPSHGWIMGFDATTLAQVGIFAVTPDAYLGGIWQGGRAPTVDAAGNAYFVTGNGRWDGIRNFGDSVLKFSVTRTGLTLIDYFTPDNEAQLSLNDKDLSGSSFTLLPGTNLLLGGGKEGVLYLLNAASLGKKVANDAQIVQKINVNGGHVMGGPVFWQSSTAGPLVYNWSELDVLTAYRLSSGRLSTTPYAEGHVLSPGHPGGSLTISANGGSTGTGIVWASIPAGGDAKHELAQGILRAFNAQTLEQIWTSEQNAARDRIGNLIKFVPPVVANGKVFMPNHDNAVAVYGLLPANFTVSVTPENLTIAPGGSASLSVGVAADHGFAGMVRFSASGMPSGVTASFTPSSTTGSGQAAMKIAVSAGAAAGKFNLTVHGTSGVLDHAAGAVLVTVSAPSKSMGAVAMNFGNATRPMVTSERAGVVAQSHWNNTSGASRGTPLALVDETGTATSVRAIWTANSTWLTPITDAPGNARMMKGYLDTTSSSTTRVTVTGLSQRTYDVYLYADGDNRGHWRSAAYTMSGPGIPSTTITLTDAANTTFSSAFSRASNGAGNYVKFTITGTAFTITAKPLKADTATLRATINGLQIVPSAVTAPAVGGQSVP